MAFPIDRRLVRLKVTKTTIRTCLKGTESKVMAGQLFRSREGSERFFDQRQVVRSHIYMRLSTPFSLLSAPPLSLFLPEEEPNHRRVS